MVGNVACEQFLQLRRQFRFHAWDYDMDDIAFNFRKHCFFAVEVVVLCRNHDGIDALRYVVVAIFDRYL
ncbi:hypothetical protein D3C87_1576480 [compost metagenome]